MDFIRLDRKLSKILHRKHKNSKVSFYLKGISRMFLPSLIHRGKLEQILDSVTDFDSKEIEERVNYCNKQDDPFQLGGDAVRFADLTTQSDSAYYFDLQESIRYFAPQLRFHCQFGDVIEVPRRPAFVKSRPIGGGNSNSILLKLNKVRHFTFVSDEIEFKDKLDMMVWRGKAIRNHRIRFMQQYHKHPLLNIGQSNPVEEGGDPSRQKRFMPIEEQLRYKFIFSIEGNDVGTNLKWIMSSNSLCLMKKPLYETWFMEGRLIPDKHYVLLKDDYSDLEEKINYYRNNQDAALEIIGCANQYVKQFQNREKERLVSLLVLNKYFEKSGQLTP